MRSNELKSANDVQVGFRGSVQLTDRSAGLKRPIEEKKRDVFGIDVEALSRKLAEKGDSYETHFGMNGKLVIFALHKFKEGYDTGVLLDDGTIRRPNDAELKAYRASLIPTDDDVLKLQQGGPDSLGNEEA
jgi:hypothetical protein